MDGDGGVRGVVLLQTSSAQARADGRRAHLGGVWVSDWRLSGRGGEPVGVCGSLGNNEAWPIQTIRIKDSLCSTTARRSHRRAELPSSFMGAVRRLRTFLGSRRNWALTTSRI